MSRLLSAIGLMLALSIARDATALSCSVTVGEKEHIRRSFDTASAVFSAHVEEIHFGRMYGRDGVRMAKLRVLDVWKGDLRPGDLVVSGADETTGLTSGGMAPELHSAILAYVHGEQPYTLGPCDRSAPLESRSSDIPLLDKLSGKTAVHPGR